MNSKQDKLFRLISSGVLIITAILVASAVFKQQYQPSNVEKLSKSALTSRKTTYKHIEDALVELNNYKSCKSTLIEDIEFLTEYLDTLDSKISISVDWHIYMLKEDFISIYLAVHDNTPGSYMDYYSGTTDIPILDK